MSSDSHLTQSIAATQFLHDFLGSSNSYEPAPSVSFANVSCLEGVDKICASLIQCIKSSRISPKFRLVDAAQSDLHKEKRQLPRLLLFPVGTIDPCEGEADAWRNLEMHVYVHPPSSSYPFKYGSTKVISKLRRYVAAQFTRQHRTFTFSLVFWRDLVWLLRWDHAGYISTSFNFHKEPHLLAEFFWKYSDLTAASRGFDTTATKPSPREISRWQKAVQSFMGSSSRKVDYLHSSFDADFPVYKVAVNGRNGRMHLIIGSPFHGFDYENPFGRATRVYAAYLLAAKKIVVLKDFWRYEHPHMHSEAELYHHLEECKVPHLPTNLAAGDVADGELQQTVTQRYGESTDYGYVKQRIVQEFAFPLRTAKSTQELTQVMRDVVNCIYHAWFCAHILHQDISTGNIMITEEGRGILNDWDIAWRLDPNDASHYPTRAGTWRFMSTKLSRDPTATRNVHDDLESCFWVILWMAIHYVKPLRYWPEPDWNLFDDCDKIYVDGTDQDIGGHPKHRFIKWEKMNKLKWRCEPFNGMMDLMREFFAEALPESLLYPKVDPTEWVPKQEPGPEHVLRLIDILDRALAENDWRESDVVRKDLFPYRSKEEWDEYNERKYDAGRYDCVTNYPVGWKGDAQVEEPAPEAAPVAIAPRRSGRVKKPKAEWRAIPKPTNHKQKAVGGEKVAPRRVVKSKVADEGGEKVARLRVNKRKAADAEVEDVAPRRSKRLRKGVTKADEDVVPAARDNKRKAAIEEVEEVAPRAAKRRRG